MREKYIVLILIILLVAVGFFMLTASMISKNTSNIGQLDNKIKVSQEKLNSARIMDEQLSQFALIIDNSLTRKPSFSFDEVNQFKTSIGELAHHRRITINKLSDANKFSLPGLIETTYNMELEATFVQMGQFVSDLEALDHIIKIHALDITPAQISDKDKSKLANTESRYRVTIELSIFKVKKEA
ncbi:MAG: type 4a pilus biogenesis protein PilO [Candidatus Cloacimonadaceae bacterium]|nr:type 4a pilus biogenesis protein PilO [Candidatus Cloacimonadaceae bacterium]MDP3113524.1 type 4a pilus biogenesis protein PilO [Candidatus Cloacimonadaceae bacterium]